VCPLAETAHVAPCSEPAPSQASQLEQRPANDVASPVPPSRPTRAELPLRQRQVAELASRGDAQKVIAYKLGIAQSTVATHLRKALTRMDICRYQLAGAMVRDGAEGEAPIPASSWEALSSAERVIIDAALDGRTNEEIARARNRSPRTIANQLAAAYRKLGVGSRGELFARYAARDHQPVSSVSR
jgi:DNA-binding NarL/FixJ family response regulator